MLPLTQDWQNPECMQKNLLKQVESFKCKRYFEIPWGLQQQLAKTTEKSSPSNIAVTKAKNEENIWNFDSAYFHWFIQQLSRSLDKITVFIALEISWKLKKKQNSWIAAHVQNRAVLYSGETLMILPILLLQKPLSN